MFPSAKLLCWLLTAVAFSSSGCALVPNKLHQPQFHNPWPQLRKVAIAPFYNLSENPTVNQDEFAHHYFNELQRIPGFEVVPVGVTRRAMQTHGIQGESAEDFQRLAQLMEVDAVVAGSVNDFTPYYPPRLAMTVRWYSANPCYHPMPNGYGLPWGRAEEEYIPDSLKEATEFDLATAQLETQTPLPPAGSATSLHAKQLRQLPSRLVAQTNSNEKTLPPVSPAPVAGNTTAPSLRIPAGPSGSGLPLNWPDPRGLIPAAPQAICDECRPHVGPILSHTRSYNGHDSDFTEALAGYYEFRDEARFGGWQAYLQRSEDFIRFCCYMHITEMLAARGGARETKVVYRWPLSRYER